MEIKISITSYFPAESTRFQKSRFMQSRRTLCKILTTTIIYMNITNSYDLIFIGLLTRALQNVNEEDSVEEFLLLFSQLKTALENSSMTVSISAISNINSLNDKIEALKKMHSKGKIGLSLADGLHDEMKVIENIIFSEALTKDVYVLPARRYNGDYLINNPGKLLKDGIFDKLTDMAKFDFIAACRCLSFGEATASAFHILRATEDTLKEYYFKYKKTKRLAKPMWGPMTQELRNKKKPKPSDSILNALDVVRVSYRNPTQHPQAIYDLDSSQDLLGVCIDLINKMAIEL